MPINSKFAVGLTVGLTVILAALTLTPGVMNFVQMSRSERLLLSPQPSKSVTLRVAMTAMGTGGGGDLAV